MWQYKEKVKARAFYNWKKIKLENDQNKDKRIGEFSSLIFLEIISL